MSTAKRDPNRVPTLIGVSSTDGTTPILLEVDPVSGRLRVIALEQEVVPTDASKTNPSMSFTYTSGNLTQIDKVIDGVTYRKTLAYTGDVLDSISAWVEV